MPDLLFFALAFAVVYAFDVLKRLFDGLPPGPWDLPFVGYLPLFWKEPRAELRRLHKKYGDVFGFYSGSNYVVVVADYAAAQELLSKPSTANRPPHLFHFIPDGVGVSCLNGAEWVEQRRYTLQKMKNLGFGRSPWEKLVQAEVRNVLDEIGQWDGQPMDIDKLLFASISNNVMSLVSGHQLPVGDPRRNIVDEGVESSQTISPQTGIVSFYPRLFQVAVKMGLIDVKGKLEAIKKMNGYIRKTVEELKQATESESYIFDYLMKIERSSMLKSKNSFNVTNLVGNVQALLIAGSDTTKLSLQWLFLAMASFQEVQDKIHRELDIVLGKDGEVSCWADRLRLPYCHATILEGQRWRTILPLNLLHRTDSDTKLRNYFIPKGSNIISFLWAFHNDERHWKDPEKFLPERFLDQEGKVRNKIENFAPFSVGKRSCIGETVAYIELFLYFVGVMQRFRILPAHDGHPPNLEGCLGVTLQPQKQPLRYVPR